MHVLITGAAGMIGRRLTARLAADGAVGQKKLTALTLHDIVRPPAPDIAGAAVTTLAGDFAAPECAAGLIREKPDLIFHLAGVVSGEAEGNFELGYRVNFTGIRNLFEAIRQAGDYFPRLVFASSIAVFGAPFPEIIPDDFAPVPLSSYGTQKLMGELLLNDYSRRGFLDGVGLRLPTICVRPGAPNKAASGFFSGIIREPLAGKPAVLPVPRSVVHTHASPRSAVGFLLHAAKLDPTLLGARRNLTLPGVAVSVAEQIEALRRAAGDKAVRLIREESDEAVWAIVKNWPARFDAARARELDFAAETDFDAIVRAHIEDESSGGVQPAEEASALKTAS